MNQEEFPYDPDVAESIEAYAKQLLGKSLRETLGGDIVQSFKGKGGFGQLVEKLYFKYEPNSKAEPDFPIAGVELKTSPVVSKAKGLFSKERLVFNIINYNEEHKETFRTSSFWKKNNLLLLMFYLYEQEREDLDYIFKIIRLWEFPATDLKIIKDDWEKIIKKIRDGKAHELSEGDTLYLGACTKGANNESKRAQPFSDSLAMQRAFSLKSKYLNYIIEVSLNNIDLYIDRNEYRRILNDDQFVSEPYAEYKKVNITELEPIVKTIDEYQRNETFEDHIIRKFVPYYGLSEAEISSELNIALSKAKSKFHNISKAILGVRKKKIEEFEKADVEMKTIRLKATGALKESMSFAQIQYKEIIYETWEESYWFHTLTKRFFFVVFKEDKDGAMRLDHVKFWTMPIKDLEIAKSFWLDTRAKILANDFENFIKMSHNRICHVRPKGSDSYDLMETITGNWVKKKCYWLNSSYIKSVIEN